MYKLDFDLKSCDNQVACIVLMNWSNKVYAPLHQLCNTQILSHMHM